MRPMPTPKNLVAAVQCVIESNRADGYVPTRFIQITEDGTAPNLLAICTRLINKGELLEYLESAVKACPKLLLLEDLVSKQGAEWGFDERTVEMAAARSKRFDEVARGKRYGCSYFTRLSPVP